MDLGARQSPWLLATKQDSNSAHHINRIEMKQQGFTPVGQKEGYKPTVEFYNKTVFFLFVQDIQNHKLLC